MEKEICNTPWLGYISMCPTTAHQWRSMWRSPQWWKWSNNWYQNSLTLKENKMRLKKYQYKLQVLRNEYTKVFCFYQVEMTWNQPWFRIKLTITPPYLLGVVWIAIWKTEIHIVPSPSSSRVEDVIKIWELGYWNIKLTWKIYQRKELER